MRSLILLIPLLPLIGFLLNISWGKQLPKKISGGIGVLAVLMSFLLVVYGWLQSSGSESTIDYTYFKWIETSAFSINFGFQLDNLSFLMMSIITGVGFLIHLYSDGYMHKDDGYYRFFTYLNLFIFFMLLLVMGSNLLITYIGWEGVGLCSYLLIGFWFKNHEYNDAAKKAFIVNRIGDLGFIVGIFFCLLNYKTIEYAALNELAAGSIQIGSAVVTTITLALFFGSTAKSAQIPLYTWLPDAMAGPTPVSALIHAATMVTAGIYMITRLNGLFLAAPFTLDVILVVGTATALVAAIIATRQNDIKKVLAYSTVSQLGFMFAALGAGAFVSGMFHLTTHAFFKALLFLGSGSVIHAMSGEQDIRNMGGLKSLKVTHLTFLIGTLAIAGIPPLSGFFSKDEILVNVYSKSFWFFIILFATAMLTAYYMFRLYFLTFHGKFRGTKEQADHLHESPLSMTFPLMVLAILAVVGGFLGIPEVFHMPHTFNEMLGKIVKIPELTVSHTFEYTVMGISTLIVGAIIYLTYQYFVTKEKLPSKSEKGFWSTAISNKFYIDEAYDSLVVAPVMGLSKWLYRVLDRSLTDGLVNQVGLTTLLSGQSIRKLQTGRTSLYLFAMVLGLILILCLNFFNR